MMAPPRTCELSGTPVCTFNYSSSSIDTSVVSPCDPSAISRSAGSCNGLLETASDFEGAAQRRPLARIPCPTCYALDDTRYLVAMVTLI